MVPHTNPVGPPVDPRPTRCVAVKDNGRRCGSRSGLNPTNGLCLWHDPDREERADGARARGRENARKQKRRRPRRGIRVVEEWDLPGPPPQTLEDALRWASWAVGQVAVGRLDAATGNVVGSLLRAYVQGRSQLDRTDERIAALQDALRKLTRAEAET